MWKYLQAQEVALELQRTERRDLFQPQPLTVLAVQVKQPAEQPPLFYRAAGAFPDLTFYDADIPPALRHAAQYATFPLAYCRLQTDERGKVDALQVLDSPWDLDPEPPPLRTLALQPDVDPAHADRVLATARTAGVQVSSYPLCCVTRSICIPQLCGSADW